MKIIFVLFISISLLTIRCSDNKNHNRKSFSVSKFQWIQSENSIPKLIRYLEMSDCVYGQVTGIAGEENIVYSCFDRLYKIAPDSIWLELAKSKNAPARVYAYKALFQKKSTYIGKVKEILKNDTSSVCWRSNDTDLETTVGVLISNFPPQ